MSKSIQRELNSFFKTVRGKDYDIQEVTKGALTQARAKLKPEAFIEMNQAAVAQFYEGAPYWLWKDYRLLAVDGSTLNLPDQPSVAGEFGVLHAGCNADVKRSMARISICYDVLNLAVLDARIDKYVTSERALLNHHLDQIEFKNGDLLLLDRGYPSIALMYELHQKGIHFCMRMKTEWWKEVEQMVAKNETDKIVSFQLPPKDRALMKLYNSQSKTVSCRLSVIDLGNGEKEVLCTALMDSDSCSLVDLKELYHYRWGAEEAYKLLKCRMDLEVFSGKTAISVKQNFYAKIIMMTTCAALSFPIDQKLRKENERNKPKYPKQPNKTNALAFMKSAWVTLWVKKKLKALIKELDKILYNTADIIRNGRSFKRKHWKNKKPPAMTYKRL
jgi:Transposase DDE domain